MYYRLLLFLSLIGAALLSRSQQTDTAPGDSQCGTLMCIAATVNGTETTYILRGLGVRPFGWMAVGFGRQMANTPMVIMWLNPDGSVTLSQRTAPREVMPTVDRNPPRVAAIAQAFITTSKDTPQLAFTIPTAPGTTVQSIIYAYGSNQPSSSAVDATLIQHLDYGITQLDFSKQISQPTPGGGAPLFPPSPPPSAGGLSIPLSSREKIIVAHAIFSVLGFLVLLPIGVLLARYLRTTKIRWFAGHWVVQFLCAGVSITIGLILGISAVARRGGSHLSDDHKKWGIALFVLYAVQCSLGAFIHFVKNPDRKRRPPQNYFHALFGLLIISLAFYQTRLGYHMEWPTATGRGPLPKSVPTLFWVWLGILTALYIIGLGFLPKQYKIEGQPPMKRAQNSQEYKLDTL